MYIAHTRQMNKLSNYTHFLDRGWVGSGRREDKDPLFTVWGTWPSISISISISNFTDTDTDNLRDRGEGEKGRDSGGCGDYHSNKLLGES